MKTKFKKTEATVPDMMMMMMSHCKRGVAKCLALSLTYTTCRQQICKYSACGTQQTLKARQPTTLEEDKLLRCMEGKTLLLHAPVDDTAILE
jgi:hypothetical protein